MRISVLFEPESSLSFYFGSKIFPCVRDERNNLHWLCLLWQQLNQLPPLDESLPQRILHWVYLVPLPLSLWNIGGGKMESLRYFTLILLLLNHSSAIFMEVLTSIIRIRSSLKCPKIVIKFGNFCHLLLLVHLPSPHTHRDGSGRSNTLQYYSSE